MNTTQAEHAHHGGTPYTQSGSQSQRTDHKRIGRLYLGFSAVLFLVSAVLSTARVPQALHVGLLSLAPGVAGAFGTFVLPLQLGARNVAFPGLNLWGFRLYAVGALLVIAGAFAGGPILPIGGMLVGVSLVLMGANFIVTIHKLRAPGMGWAELPHFVWCIYASSVAMITIVPALLVATLAHALSPNLFDALAGGDAGLGASLSVYGNAAAVVLLLPAFGVVSEMVATFSRSRLFGAKTMAHAAFALAIVGFLAWGHHAFAPGQSLYAGTVYGFALAPVAAMVVGWVMTLHAGAIELSTPLLYAVGAIVLATLGMLSGLFLAAPASAAYLSDTWMVVGHFETCIVGTSAMALFGGAHYWWPKIAGASAESGVGKASALLFLIGGLVAMDGAFSLGLTGLSREALDLADVAGPASDMAINGLGAMALAGALAVINLFRSVSGGACGANPWGGRTVEWTTQSPPIAQNFNQPPTVVEGPYEYPAQAGGAKVEAH